VRCTLNIPRMTQVRLVVHRRSATVPAQGARKATVAATHNRGRSQKRRTRSKAEDASNAKELCNPTDCCTPARRWLCPPTALARTLPHPHPSRVVSLGEVTRWFRQKFQKLLQNICTMFHQTGTHPTKGSAQRTPNRRPVQRRRRRRPRATTDGRSGTDRRAGY
jgi:hypothetical protein